VVWVKRWATDTRAEIDGAGMVDPRVTHLRDAGNVVGQGFLDRFGVDFGGLDYDFFLFPSKRALRDECDAYVLTFLRTAIGQGAASGAATDVAFVADTHRPSPCWCPTWRCRWSAMRRPRRDGSTSWPSCTTGS
jgi:hypothetical protein